MTTLAALPRSARERLAAPIAEWASGAAAPASASTLPLPPAVAERYADAVSAQARELQDSADRLIANAADIGGAAYPHLVELIREHVALLGRGVGLALSLAAFERFGAHWAGTVVAESRAHGEALVRMIVEDAVVARSDVAACSPLPVSVDGGGRSALAEVFDMDAEPVDDVGRFAVGRVHAHYAYRRAQLESALRPHLESLGVPLPGSTLAVVIVLGEIVSAPDPVIALRALRWMLDALRGAGSPETLTAFRAEHRRREAEILQSRRQAARALRDAAEETDPEDIAHQLAEAYRRVVEGPVRHFLWSFTALRSGAWTPTPGLAVVEGAARGSGGWIRTLAALTIFRPLRNGSAHESLRWEPRSEEFAIGEARYDAGTVRDAVDVGRSLEAGCESAMVLVRLAESKADWRGLPRAGYDVVSRRQQTDASFGANRLPLRSLTPAGSSIRAVVDGLSVDLVNPALQALLHTRRIWTEFDVYEIGQPGQQKPLIRVTGAALDRAEEPWLFAYERFPEMPFSAFLTINLDARLQVEPAAVAARAVHWIAIRDILTAFADCADLPPDESQMRLRDHLTLVSIALGASSEQIPPTGIGRHRRLLAEVDAATIALAGSADGALDRVRVSTAAQRLLHWYRALDPAVLMPGVR